MGKCSTCGRKIEYNKFKKVDKLIYCPKCAEKKIAEVLAKTVKDAHVTFDEFEKAMDEVADSITEPTVKAKEAGKRLGVTLEKITKPKNTTVGYESQYKDTTGTDGVVIGKSKKKGRRKK